MLAKLQKRLKTWLVGPELQKMNDSLEHFSFALQKLVDEQRHFAYEVQFLQRQIQSKGMKDAFDAFTQDELNRCVNGYVDLQHRLARLEGKRNGHA